MRSVIAFVNPKGGSSKTTSVFSLGAALAAQGHRVLLLDLDPLAGLTVSAGLEVGATGDHTVLRWLVTPNQGVQGVAVHLAEGMSIIPGGLELAGLEARLGTQKKAMFLVRNALQREPLAFDFVLVDTPPGINALVVAGLVAADAVIVPVQSSYLSMFGVRAALDLINNLQRNKQLALYRVGVLLTMVSSTSMHAGEVVTEVRAVFPELTFTTMIPESDALREAPVAGHSVLTYAPDDPAAQAYRALAEEVGAYGWSAG
ncbi:MAG: ParA family protein [Anaerolineae bacterium]